MVISPSEINTKMLFDRSLYFPGLDPDIPLRDRRAAVLKKVLDKRDIIPAVFIDLCRIEFPETVRADPGIIQIITYEL